MDLLCPLELLAVGSARNPSAFIREIQKQTHDPQILLKLKGRISTSVPGERQVRVVGGGLDLAGQSRLHPTL